MSPKQRKGRKSTYVPAPTVPREHLERFVLVLKATTGEVTVAEAARSLGLSRNHFQTLMHRGVGALIEAIIPKEPGRPARSEREMELEEQVKQLTKQLETMQSEVETSHRLLAVASEVLRGQASPKRSPRNRRKRKTKTTSGGGPEEPEPEPELLLERVTEMTKDGVPARLAAMAVGRAPSSVRRWVARSKRGEPLRRRRGPKPGGIAPDPDIVDQVQQHVRALRGQVGADSLRRTFPGVSRRAALGIKRTTLTEMERERKQDSARVQVVCPGVVRGFDAMHICGGGERRYALFAADGCVPYRTTACSVARYDSPSVVDTLAEDIERNGAPLVLRLDRASCQRTADVRDLADRHGILLLHGPAHHPRFYGQLERQNREHRAWLLATERVAFEELDEQLATMKHALNERWRRRTLAWRTAGELWRERPKLQENRARLRREIEARAARLELDLVDHRDAKQRAWRLAIEQSLTERGYLRVQQGRWC